MEGVVEVDVVAVAVEAAVAAAEVVVVDSLERYCLDKVDLAGPFAAGSLFHYNQVWEDPKTSAAVEIEWPRRPGAKCHFGSHG